MKPDENLMSILVMLEYHAETNGEHIWKVAWPRLRKDIEAAQLERQNLLMAYEELQESKLVESGS